MPAAASISFRLPQTVTDGQTNKQTQNRKVHVTIGLSGRAAGHVYNVASGRPLDKSSFGVTSLLFYRSLHVMHQFLSEIRDLVMPLIHMYMASAVQLPIHVRMYRYSCPRIGTPTCVWYSCVWVNPYVLLGLQWVAQLHGWYAWLIVLVRVMNLRLIRLEFTTLCTG